MYESLVCNHFISQHKSNMFNHNTFTIPIDFSIFELLFIQLQFIFFQYLHFSITYIDFFFVHLLLMLF